MYRIFHIKLQSQARKQKDVRTIFRSNHVKNGFSNSVFTPFILW